MNDFNFVEIKGRFFSVENDSNIFNLSYNRQVLKCYFSSSISSDIVKKYFINENTGKALMLGGTFVFEEGRVCILVNRIQFIDDFLSLEDVERKKANQIDFSSD